MQDGERLQNVTSWILPNNEFKKEITPEELSHTVYVNDNFCDDDRITVKKEVLIESFLTIILHVNLHSDHNFQIQNILNQVELNLVLDRNGIRILLRTNTNNEIQIPQNTEICIILTNKFHKLESAIEDSLMLHEMQTQKNLTNEIYSLELKNRSK